MGDAMRSETIAEKLAAQVVFAGATSALQRDVVHAVERILLDSMACALGAAKFLSGKPVGLYTMNDVLGL